MKCTIENEIFDMVIWRTIVCAVPNHAFALSFQLFNECKNWNDKPTAKSLHFCHTVTRQRDIVVKIEI